MDRKLRLICWFDRNVMDRWTDLWWWISGWFLEHDFPNPQWAWEIATFIDLKIENTISRKWVRFMIRHGWEPKPLTEFQRRLLGACLKGYYGWDE